MKVLKLKDAQRNQKEFAFAQKKLHMQVVSYVNSLDNKRYKKVMNTPLDKLNSMLFVKYQEMFDSITKTS